MLDTTPSSIPSTNWINVLAPLTPLGTNIIAVFTFLIGLLLIFLGQKCLKLCAFCIGFGLGFISTALLCTKINLNFENMTSPQTTLIIAVVGGFIIGGFAAFLVTATKIVLAIGCGVVLAFLINSAGLSVGEHDYVMWIGLGLGFVIMLYIAFKIFDHAVVIVTSLIGALAVLMSVSHFVPELNLSLWQLLNDPSSVNGCATNTVCNGLLIGWGVLSCMGLYVQFRRLDDCSSCSDTKKDKDFDFGRLN